MSLTQFVEKPQVRALIDSMFEKPTIPRVAIIAPPQTNHYAAVGTAFDYFARFWLTQLHQNKSVQIYRHRWVAESAVDSLERTHPALHQRGAQIVEEAKARLSNPDAPIMDLVVSALSLASLDPILRAGRGYDYIGKALDPDDINDLHTLWKIMPDGQFEACDRVALNPTFGEMSNMVGGADADLIIDDTLIDIKTTKTIGLKARDFRQIIGYYLLYRIHQSIEKKLAIPVSPNINKIGIYFSRFGYLFTMRVDEILSSQAINTLNCETRQDCLDKIAYRFKLTIERKYGKIIVPIPANASDTEILTLIETHKTAGLGLRVILPSMDFPTSRHLRKILKDAGYDRYDRRIQFSGIQNVF